MATKPNNPNVARGGGASAGDVHANDPHTGEAHARREWDRFTLAQRIEHVILIITFTTLAVTGLPQKFVGNAVAEWMIGVMGGIETVRIIHRIAAVAIVLQSVYHVIVLGYKIWVRRVEMTMLPGLRDVTDAIDVIRYNLGLTKEHPKMPRYNFAEKAEYWAMVWGTVLMAITGFMLWNPIATARFLPGQVIPAAEAAHGAEAILAVLAIFVWHFYNVHLKSFNKSMFKGTMTHHQMVEEHGGELEQRVAGVARRPAEGEAVRRRERIYLPVAIVLAIIGTVAVYRFATFEQTAIATLPVPLDRAEVFTPLTPTPGPSLTQVAASLIPHPVEGQEQCDTCHGLNGMRPFPPDHEGRPNESCTVCHLPGPTPAPGAAGSDQGGSEGTGGTSAASTIPHPIEGDTYADCTTCHGLDGIRPFPENHVNFPADSCTGCHQPADEGGGEGDAAGTPGAETDGTGTPDSGAAAGPSTIPHPVEGDTYADCTTCHGLDGIRPFPENHVNFPLDTCTGCHKPADEASGEGAGSGASETTTPEAGSTGGSGTASASPIPANHDLTSELFQNCTSCHALEGVSPFPENHVNFTVEQCQTCHQQGG